MIPRAQRHIWLTVTQVFDEAKKCGSLDKDHIHKHNNSIVH